MSSLRCKNVDIHIMPKLMNEEFEKLTIPNNLCGKRDELSSHTPTWFDQCPIYKYRKGVIGKSHLSRIDNRFQNTFSGDATIPFDIRRYKNSFQSKGWKRRTKEYTLENEKKKEAHKSPLQRKK